MTYPDDVVKQGLLARFMELGDEFHSISPQIEQRQAEIKKLEARKIEIGKLGESLVEAAKAFNFDLKEAYHEKRGQSAVGSEMPSAPMDEPTPRRISIKKFVHRAAEAAYPKPVRASAIRADLVVQGEDVHEKTVGMTLYRLLKKGVLRREGFDWFFVPENERTAQEEGADA